MEKKVLVREANFVPYQNEHIASLLEKIKAFLDIQGTA
jgi:hypothetical protein